MPRNNAKRWTIMSVIIFVIGIAMIIGGIVLDEYDFYWMIFVGAVLALTFLICFFMFVSQAKRLDRLFKGKDLLAHWVFESSEQMKKAETEFREKKERHKIMLLVIGFFFVVITAIFAIFGFDDLEEAAGFIGLMAGVLAFISLVALITPYTSYNKMKKAIPEVFVGPYSAWVMGEYTQWKAPMTRITGISYQTGKTGAVIEVGFIIFQRYGPQPHVCRIPVADGHEDEALRLAKNMAVINDVPCECPAFGQG
jgi:MFS family permease